MDATTKTDATQKLYVCTHVCARPSSEPPGRHERRDGACAQLCSATRIIVLADLAVSAAVPHAHAAGTVCERSMGTTVRTSRCQGHRCRRRSRGFTCLAYCRHTFWLQREPCAVLEHARIAARVAVELDDTTGPPVELRAVLESGNQNAGVRGKIIASHSVGNGLAGSGRPICQSSLTDFFVRPE